MRTPILALAALTLAGCGKTGQSGSSEYSSAASSTMPATDTTDAKAAIARLRNEWVAAANKKDAAAVGATYTDDAVFVSSENPETRGRAAIQKAFAESFAIASDLKVSSERTEVSGDLAYDYGSYSQHVAPPKAKAMDLHGYYIVILKKQGDGSWKIARHISATPPKS